MKTEAIIGWGALGLLGYIIYVNNKTDKVEFQRVGEGVSDPPSYPADLDNDGMVATSDLLVMLSLFGSQCPSGGDCEGDLDGDNAVTVSDLLILLADFGMTDSQAKQWLQNNSIDCDYSTNICIT